MFEEASRMKLRLSTDKGHLSVEDLWDLTLQQLNAIAKSLNKSLKVSAEEDFLEETSNEDANTKLCFDIVRYIMEKMKVEEKDRKEAGTKKAKREKLLGILVKKQDDSLENLSEDELKKMLEELS